MLFPAWPRHINARFRLKATGNRTIEAEIKDGKISCNQPVTSLP